MKELYNQKVADLVASGESILESGENNAGGYTKFASGTLLLWGVGETFPYPTVIAPTFKDQDVWEGRWYP